ncbi:Ribokinase-like protein [Dipodascopsis tothii]|uniref:Ribokinase-like protein n=1 Tax=Dipodascopsis tothii TaxID=44089 RepID=UPI0034CEDBCD
MLFTTLGMFIIDRIEYRDGSVVDDIVGGAGTFALYGARTFAGGELAGRVGWIVDAGHDFPPDLRRQLDALGSAMLFRVDSGRKTTRGWNGYGEHELRLFRYLTPKRQLVAADVVGTPLGAARAVHLVCSAARARELALELRRTRPSSAAQLIVWEPVPALCTPAELTATLEVLELVDVLSPNAQEMAGLFGLDEPLVEGPDADAAEAVLEALADRALPSFGRGRLAAVIVRCGARGCLVSSAAGHRWLPSYHLVAAAAAGPAGPVVDTTGAGNTFMGGLAVGLARHGPAALLLAAVYGLVAASLAVEQLGPPALAYTDAGETWNGAPVAARLDAYLAHTGLPGPDTFN